MRATSAVLWVVVGLCLLVAALFYIVEKPNYDAAMEDYERMHSDGGNKKP